MKHPFLQKLFLALLVFTITVATRWHLVDRFYQHSFVPDSEAGISISRSFYFFFKNPRIENAPQTLSSYPTYLAGDYICAGITANLLRPLAQRGMLNARLSDSDNSLIIFSMRWNGVLFNALAATVLFLALSLLSTNIWLSATVVLMYFTFSDRVLDIGLMRVDHYMLFASYALFYFSLKIYRQPNRNLNYLLGGFLAAMATSTKLNFPFYLLIVPGIFGLLWYERKLRLSRLALFFLAYILGILFFFQRWLLYPEKAMETLTGIISTGEEWVSFWGAEPFLYFHWHQFFSDGFHWMVFSFTSLFYATMIFCAYKAIQQRDRLLLLLLAIFLAQSALLLFMPKVSRYGIILPLWVSLFITLGIGDFFGKKRSPLIIAAVAAALLSPKFIYSMNDFGQRLRYHADRHDSILQTRIAAAAWIKENASPGASILIYNPRVSNPPVFDEPYQFREIKYPFLEQEAYLNFFPPALSTLSERFDFFIVADKEKTFHLNTLRETEFEHGIDTPGVTSQRWLSFYDSLDRAFSKNIFESAVPNYGVMRYDIYSLHRGQANPPPLPEVKLLYAKRIAKSVVELCWEMSEISACQVQIAADSTFQWLTHGSYDGFKSKYRQCTVETANYIPPKIEQAMESGEFERLTGIGSASREDINNFFGNILFCLQTDTVNFGACVQNLVKEDGRYPVLMRAFEQLLAGQISSADYKTYHQLAGLPDDITQRKLPQQKIQVHLAAGKPCYWRVRLKDSEWVKSRWSAAGVISPE